MIFSAIATAIGALVGAGATSFFVTAVGFVLKTAVSLGLNYLLAPKNKAGEGFNIKGTLQSGGDLPRSFIFGLSATAGSLAYANTAGKDGKTPNAYLYQVIALSDAPSTRLEGIIVNGVASDIGTTMASVGGHDIGYPVTAYTKDGEDYMWVHFYDGTQTAADPHLVSLFGAESDRQYGADRIGTNVTYAIVRTRLNQDLFTGFPEFRFVITGMKLYDISKDSTMGGNGTHRWSDRNTWGGDGDHLVAVQAYTVLRGMYFGADWFYGLQNLNAKRLPSTNWIAQVAKCRANVVGPDGNEPQYRAGGEIPVGAKIADTLQALMYAANGKVSEIGGTYKLYVGAPDAPLWEIFDGDILSDKEQSFTPFFSLSDTINGVTCTYPSPADGWNPKVAPPIYRTDLEVFAGNRRLLSDLSLDLVPYAAQVQRIMQSSLLEAQRARRHTFVLDSSFYTVEPGDIMKFTSTRNGYEEKWFRVDGVADLASCDVMVDITEVDPDDYDWDFNTDYRPPTSGFIGIVQPLPYGMQDFAVDAISILDNNGDPRRPAIILSWSGDEQDGVNGVAYEVRNAAGPDVGTVVLRSSTNRVDANAVIVADNAILPDTAYEVRAKYLSNFLTNLIWSDWLPVTTDDIRLGTKDMYPIDIGDVTKDIVEYDKWVGESIRAIREAQERIDQLIADQNSLNYQDKLFLGREIRVTRNNLTAAYTEAIFVAVGPDGALASRIEDLEVELTDQAGDITAQGSAISALSTEVSGQGDDISANASAIDALAVTVGEVSSSVGVRAEAVASPGGGWARWGVQVKTGTGDNWSAAALYVDANTTTHVSRVVIEADQFIVSSGDDTASPFAFINGEAYLVSARIGTVYFDILKSNNEKLIIRGIGTSADISIFV